MFKLILFEMKKMWSHKYIYILCAVCLIALIIPEFRSYSVSKEYIKRKHVFYERYGGVLTEKNHIEIAKLADPKEVYGKPDTQKVNLDSMVADMAMSDISYMVSYKSLQEEVVGKASENADYYKENGYEYLSKLNRRIADTYSEYKEPWLVPGNDFFAYFKDYYYTVFAALLILIVTAGIFTREKESRMDNIIKSSYMGAKTSFFCKMAAAGLVSFIIMLVFSIVNLILSFKTQCLIGWNAPFRSIPEFFYSPLNLKIWQMAALFILIKCLAAMLMGLIFAAVSSFLKKSFVSIVVSFTILTVSFIDYFVFFRYARTLLNVNTESSGVTVFLDKARGYLFTLLFDTGSYFDNYHVISVFGQPVQTAVSCIVIAVAVILILMGTAYMNFMKKR